jgi:hypothetical protein
MGADGLAFRPDLNLVSHETHLHLFAGEASAYVVSGAGEAEIAPGIHQAKDGGVDHLGAGPP